MLHPLQLLCLIETEKHGMYTTSLNDVGEDREENTFLPNGVSHGSLPKKSRSSNAMKS